MPSTFSAETALFGIGIVFESHLPEALNCAVSAFPQDSAGKSCEQHVRVVLVADETHVPVPDFSRIDGTRLEVVEQGVTVKADGARGRASCHFHPEVVGSAPFTNAVTTAVLFLVAQAGRIPLHASAVVVDGCALVLAGRSGAGKSALALAADRAGLAVLAEDTVFLQLQPSFCVWGRPEIVHVLEKDAAARAGGAIRVRSGRVKRAIPILHRCHKADRAALFLLTHGDSVIFHKLDAEDAVRVLTRDLEPGYDFYGARFERAVRTLAKEGCWRLTLSADPGEAIAALVTMFSAASSCEAADTR